MSTLSGRLVVLFAVACGLAVANTYYAQPLIGQIATDVGLTTGTAGLVMTMTQLGYGVGLLLLVPLADVLENRRVVVLALGGAVLGLLAVSTSRGQAQFFAASFVVGIAATATHVLVPFVSHLAPPERRGRIVGNVMSGLLAGVMLARPFASLVASAFGWRAVFSTSAVMMVVLLLALLYALPQRRPEGTLRYGRAIASLGRLFVTTPLLRRRAFYQGMMFAAFNFFWTCSALLLTTTFGLTQRGLAAFALAGAAGALAAPWAGRLADRGLTHLGTGLALAAASLAMVGVGVAGAHGSLVFLVAGALVLDGAVQVCQVLGMRSLYMLVPEERGRLNGLYMALIFGCGAAASVSSTAIYATWGWLPVCCVGAGLVALALAAWATERR
ncbi:MAG: MFS transporter [Polyangia bacterium]